MPRFIALYRNEPAAEAKMAAATPEDIEAMMEAWGAWGAACGDGLVDMGAPFGPGQHLTADGVTASDSRVSGYSVLEAADMDAALALLDGHPHLSFDASAAIQVHQAMAM